jgi:hypothetical protein
VEASTAQLICYSAGLILPAQRLAPTAPPLLRVVSSCARTHAIAPGTRSLRARRFGDRIPVGGGGARFSASVQTRPGTHSASYTMGLSPGVKRPGRGVDNPPPSSAEVKERVDLPLWAFVAVLWRTLTFTFYLARDIIGAAFWSFVAYLLYADGRTVMFLAVEGMCCLSCTFDLVSLSCVPAYLSSSLMQKKKNHLSLFSIKDASYTEIYTPLCRAFGAQQRCECFVLYEPFQSSTATRLQRPNEQFLRNVDTVVICGRYFGKKLIIFCSFIPFACAECRI